MDRTYNEPSAKIEITLLCNSLAVWRSKEGNSHWMVSSSRYCASVLTSLENQMNPMTGL